MSRNTYDRRVTNGTRDLEFYSQEKYPQKVIHVSELEKVSECIKMNDLAGRKGFGHLKPPTCPITSAREKHITTQRPILNSVEKLSFRSASPNNINEFGINQHITPNSVEC